MPENFDAKVAIDYRSEKQLGVFYWAPEVEDIAFVTVVL